MSIIEQAAKRLEQLRRAGIEVPEALRPSTQDMKASAGQAVRQRDSSAADLQKRRPAESPGGRRSAADRARDDTQFEGDATGRRSREVNIDPGRLAAAGFVSPEAPRTQVADEYRVIKRPLLMQAHEKPAGATASRNLIMVTSSLPGEGKTYTSINLALSIAMELDNTVLLVDADVARPAILERLGIERSKGLLDVLTDDSLELSDVLLRTNIDRLTILPAGSPHDRATELLASDAMTRLIEELATRYPERILIFDAPPLLPSTESRVLATHMGQVILVVEAENTPASTVVQALATVESCPLVMTLLNKVARSEVGSYYGYYGNAPA